LPEQGASVPLTLTELVEIPVRMVQLSDEQSLEWQIFELSSVQELRVARINLSQITHK
jgi:hypothetical protein